jgi:hypothetical protein
MKLAHGRKRGRRLGRTENAWAGFARQQNKSRSSSVWYSPGPIKAITALGFLLQSGCMQPWACATLPMASILNYCSRLFLACNSKQKILTI